MGTLREEKRKWHAMADKLTQIVNAVNFRWNSPSQGIVAKT
jgi:hypothetical protein